MRNEKYKIPALLFGSGLSLLGVLRCMASARIPSFVATDERDFVTWSRWFRRVPGGPVAPQNSSELACDLDQLDISQAVLIPGSDLSSLAIAGLPASLETRFPSPMAPLDVQTTLTDKTKFYSVAEKLGVPYPKTSYLESRAAIEALPDSSFENAFWKPTNSQLFARDFRAKAFLCKSKADALELWDRANRHGYQLLLQEYVSGPPTCHYFIDGFMDRLGRIRCLFARQRLRMNPPDFGNSSYMVSVPLREVDAAVDSVRTILDEVGYRGIFSAEFKKDGPDGLFKIIEINARPWIFIRFAQRCGVNICELAYRDALGLKLKDVKSYSVGRHCVYPFIDFKACIALRRSKQLSIYSWLSSWVTASKPVFEWNDPGPAVKQIGRLMLRLIVPFRGSKSRQ